MRHAAPLIPFRIKNSVIDPAQIIFLRPFGLRYRSPVVLRTLTLRYLRANVLLNSCRINNCRSGPKVFRTGARPRVFRTQTKLLSFLTHIGITLLLALSTATFAQAAELGRLFFTPEQRAQLEQNRTRNATANATAEDELSSSSVLTVNGIVQKKGGARTVWINGVARSAGNSDERSPGSVPVSVPGQAQPVKLKVGQKLLLDIPPQRKPAEKKPPQQNLPAPDD